MRTFTLTVGPDGRVAIPDTQPGQTITVQVPVNANLPESMTLATAKTDEERDQVIAGIRRVAHEIRQELGDDVAASISTDELYDEAASRDDRGFFRAHCNRAGRGRRGSPPPGSFGATIPAHLRR